MAQNRTIAVIGAGIVGTLAAWRLRREGYRVVMIDPRSPGSGASSGNAGCLSPSSIVPLAGSGLIAKVPGWLLDPQGPLSIRWSYLPRLAPWLLRFVRAGRPDRVARHASALAALLAPGLDLLRQWSAAIGAADLVVAQGSLVIYRNEDSWTSDAGARMLRRQAGIAFSEIARHELHDLDPALGPVALRGLYFPDNGHTVDPRMLVSAFVRSFVAAGGTVRQATVRRFVTRNARLVGIDTDEGVQEAHMAVLAAGAFSASLARDAGSPIPLETERGYHAMVGAHDAGPRLPTVDATAKIVATPMTAGVRFTGSVEFAGLAAPPDWRRARAILALGRELYPGMDSGSTREDMEEFWMGHRPSTPDSLPVIGRSRCSPDILFAFGHGHLGMTGAPQTAELVAELVAGHSPSISLAPFSPDRFTGARRDD